MTEFEFKIDRATFYKAPIQIVQEQMSSIESQLANETLKVIHKYGIYVDKDELIKALKYDRQQYDKGIEEKCAREYNTLCLYVAFYKNSFQSTVDIELNGLSTKRPDFVE